ncbi:protein rtoA-like [Oppia nitens]|uniref:protein rtoA-like n=1 Tax=Oppia nitens TaxID=1686743 RepID=UPI0023DC819B|nr:protein rtoA-like [Oppia nitens]
MDFHHLKYVCFLLLASLVLTLASDQQNPNISEIDDKIPEKPEPRQIGAAVPYGWLQPAQAVAAPVPPPVSNSWASFSPSWLPSGQSLLALLKPNVIGGRRSSLSSRLRNLMNALFYRRETSSPYMGSGSSYSYAFRPPPFGFSSSFPNSALTSALGGSGNMYGSASSYRPVVLPNYAAAAAAASAPADSWNNYKPFGQSSGQSSYSGSPSNLYSGNSGSPSQSSAIWQSGSGSGSGSNSGSQYSSAYPSYSNSGSGSSNTAYQASASNVYPSNTSYQRSSVSTYSKPQTSVNTSVSSSSVSSSVSSVSSSAANNPKSAAATAYQSK